MHDDRQARVAQVLAHPGRQALRLVALVHDIDLAFGPRLLAGALLPQVQQAFHADGKADRRRGLAAQQFDQPVIAAAAAYRALRPRRSVTHSKTVRL